MFQCLSEFDIVSTDDEDYRVLDCMRTEQSLPASSESFSDHGMQCQHLELRALIQETDHKSPRAHDDRHDEASTASTFAWQKCFGQT